MNNEDLPSTPPDEPIQQVAPEPAKEEFNAPVEAEPETVSLTEPAVVETPKVLVEDEPVPTPEQPMPVPDELEVNVGGPTQPPPNESSFEDEVKPPVRRPPSTTVMQQFETSSTLTEEEAEEATELCLLTDTVESTQKAIRDLPNVNFADTEEGSRWARIISFATETTPYGDWFQRTVNREGAKFRQGVESERGLLTPYAAKFNDKEASMLTGEKAVIRVRALLGMGGLASIPLWHSGFWITLKAPTEAKLLDLSRKLGQNKAELGRQTYGLAFANTTVMFAEYITNFVIEHIYETTLKPELQASIKDHISILDLHVLAWGLACLVYPKGFPYMRSVLDQTKQPNKIIREKLNIGKLLWEDNSAFTQWQIGHMANRASGHMTLESINRYVDEFTIGKARKINLREGCDITIATPSINKYITSGRKWISSIVEMVTTAFAIENTDTNREDYIRDQGRASSMRQFAHWVESLEVKGEEYSSVETLELILNALSSEEKVRLKFFDAIKDFMEDATIAIVAIPITENEELGPLPRFPHLIPIDALNVFFILLERKKKSIQERD